VTLEYNKKMKDHFKTNNMKNIWKGLKYLQKDKRHQNNQKTQKLM